MRERDVKEPLSAADAEVLRRLNQMTRRSFAVAGIGAAAGLSLFGWMKYLAPRADGIPWPLRRSHELNEALTRAAFSPERQAATFPEAAATTPRVNGGVGLQGAVDLAAWRLRIEDDRGRTLRLTLAEVAALPRVGMTTELKCIEGWSTVVHWAGATLGSLAKRYRLGTRSGQAPDPERRPDDLYNHVSLTTPDGEYYVGLDMASALHSQTLLCDEMNGAALTAAHGAPLRLVIPLKYGIKNIKRIGVIRFTDARPRDYWTERGYDWYAGH
jgi:DMSO/TMAO reductase YedYZ molybdopterin-dependent catalytic subunit